MRHFFLAPTDGEAVDTARAAMREYNARFTYLWRDQENPVMPLEIDFDQLLADRLVLAGSPDTVAEWLTDLIHGGPAQLLRRGVRLGSLGHEDVLRSLQLFQTAVAPVVRQATEHQAAGLFEDVPSA